jgi:hypothetical protein
MNYSEAEKYRDKYGYLVPAHFNLNLESGVVRREIMPLVISPKGDIGRVIEELCKNEGDNKKALLKLYLISRDLRVYCCLQCLSRVGF